MPTYADVQAYYERLVQANELRLAPRIAAAKKLALKLEDLEATTEWGAFQALATAKVEAAEAGVASARDSLEDAVGPERDQAQLALKQAKGRVQGMQEILAIAWEMRQQAEGA